MSTLTISNDQQHQAALVQISDAMGRDPESPETEALSALIDAVAAYEQRRFPIAPPTPRDLLEFRLEQAGVSAEAITSMLRILDESGWELVVVPPETTVRESGVRAP